MGRKGGRSLWKATYEIFDASNTQEFKIEEDNAFVKIMDAVFLKYLYWVYLPDMYLIQSIIFLMKKAKK